MARPATHDTDAMLDAARTVLLRVGVEGATVQAISHECGAPVGSLYNRFASRQDLLARLWLRAAERSHAACMPSLLQADARKAAVELALRLVQFAREQPADARLLASFRREDLLSPQLASSLAERLEQLNVPVQRALKQLAKRLYGDTRAESLRQVSLAVVDLPLAAVQRYALAGRPVPRDLDPHVERGVRAILTKRAPR